MMFVYTIEAPYEHQFFTLAYVLWIKAEVNCMPVFSEILDHSWSNEGEFIRKVYVTIVGRFHLVHIDHI